jgi:hypothetical protein
MAVQYLGYILIGLGIVIILLALLLGYGIYISASGNLNSASLVSPSGSSTINGSVSNLTTGLQGIAAIGTYTAIEVAVLFLIASIGYKLSYLGLQMNGRQAAPGKQAKVND